MAIDVSKILADALQAGDEEIARAGAVHEAIKVASHTVKVISPIIKAAMRFPETSSPEQLNELVGQVMNKVRNDTGQVLKSLDISPSDTPDWLSAQVAGQLTGIITTAIERDNGSALEVGRLDYITPIVDYISDAQEISNSFVYGGYASPEIRMLGALGGAVSTVMMEYQAFSYYHSRPHEVANAVSEKIKTRVIDETLANYKEHYSLNDEEYCYLGVTLVHHAGQLLAGAWQNNVANTVAYMKELTPEQRRSTAANGFPLDVIFQDFENQYSGIEFSVVAALNAMRGDSANASASQKKSNAPRQG